MENDDSEVIGFVNQGLVTEYVDTAAFLFGPKVPITSFGVADFPSGDSTHSIDGNRDGYGRLIDPDVSRKWDVIKATNLLGAISNKPVEEPMSTLDILAAELQMSEDDVTSMPDDAIVMVNKRTLLRVIWQAQKSERIEAGLGTHGDDMLLKVNPPIREQPKPKPEKSPKLHKLLFNPNDKV